MMTLFSYLDPGTGSLIVQAVIGIIASVGFFFRHTVVNFYYKITGRGTKKDSKDK